MRNVCVLIGAVVAFMGGAFAQDGVMGDIMSGKLVNPSVGVWAWYDVKDTASGDHLFLRQAVVGEAKVEGKAGFWVETEVLPRVGFPIVYKMLLTGPASDPQNVHKVILKDGQNPPQELKVDPSAAAGDTGAKANRTTVGHDSIDTAQGPVEADHVVMEQDGKKTDLWMSEKVPPMGIVKMVSPDGEIVLQRYGKGGPDAESAVDRKTDPSAAKGDTKVTVKVNGEVREVEQNPAASQATAPQTAPDAGTAGAEQKPSKSKEGGSAQKKNYKKKKDAQ